MQTILLRLVMVLTLMYALTGPGSSSAQALVIYSNDFQSKSAGGEWSNNSVTSAPNPDYTPWGGRWFLGEFGVHNGVNDVVSLSLNGLPENSRVRLSFDVYFIRSWDGNDTRVSSIINDPNGQVYGPDFFNVRVAGGPLLLHETFSNGNPAGQSYSPYGPSILPPSTGYGSMTGAAEAYSLGYTFGNFIESQNQNKIDVMDSVYHFDFGFTHALSALQIDFFAENLQSMADESWGIDNVIVAVVPEPASALLVLFGGAALLALGFKRRGKFPL